MPQRKAKVKVEIKWSKYLALWFPFLMGISALATLEGVSDTERHPVLRGLLIGLFVLNVVTTYQWVMYIYIRIHGVAIKSAKNVIQKREPDGP